MGDIIRGRDCVVFFKGDSYTVSVSDEMVNKGWRGGQGVRWVDTTQPVRVVSYSNGLYGGFLIWGSDEAGDDFASMTRTQPTYRYATLLLGGSLMSTTTYERYTYASRVGGGPLVPLEYKVNKPLYFSLRGYWTIEDEPTQVSASYAPAFFTGIVAQVHKKNNNFFLGIQTSL